MAHFAKIENNKVIQVIAISDNDCGGGNFPSSELIGQEFIASLNINGHWLQTSYNNNFRGTYAGIGFSYDPSANVFIEPAFVKP